MAVQIVNPKDFGAKGDTLYFYDGVATAGSTNFTSAAAVFAATDVGKVISIAGAGASGADLRTTIAARVSNTQITLAAAASTAVTAAKGHYLSLIHI